MKCLSTERQLTVKRPLDPYERQPTVNRPVNVRKVTGYRPVTGRLLIGRWLFVKATGGRKSCEVILKDLIEMQKMLKTA